MIIKDGSGQDPLSSDIVCLLQIHVVCITKYTVQIHEGHIMRKMEADSFATLVKLAGKLNLESTNAS